MKKFLPDVLLVAGAALVSAGAYLAWAPAGFIAAGAFLLLVGLKWPESEGAA